MIKKCIAFMLAIIMITNYMPDLTVYSAPADKVEAMASDSNAHRVDGDDTNQAATSSEAIPEVEDDCLEDVTDDMVSEDMASEDIASDSNAHRVDEGINEQIASPSNAILVEENRPDYIPDDALYNADNGHWYKYCSDSTDWQGANEKCEAMQGYLATITSQDEKEFLSPIFTSRYGAGNNQGAAWLGLHYLDEWTWVSGETFDYSNWNSGEPNGDGKEPYAIINKNQYWNDGSAGWYPYICEWDLDETQPPIIKDSIEKALVEQVERYATGEMSDLLLKIVNTDLPIEEKYRRLNQFFNYFGILEPQEGIDFIIESQGERYAYDLMTNNEIFTAYQYENFLNSGTAEAVAARAALFLSGLVYNNELLDFFSLDTATGQLAGVKKYKTMLLSYMDASTKEMEMEKYAEEGVKFVKNYSKTMEIADTNVEKFIKEFDGAKTNKERSAAVLKFEKNNVKMPGEKISYMYKDTEFCKGLGYGFDALKLVDFTVKDITDFFTLSARYEAYMKHKEFLQEILNAEELPWELRAAAGFISEDFEKKYEKTFSDLWNDIFEFTLDQVSGELEIGKNLNIGNFEVKISDGLLVLSIATYVSNALMDVGNMVEQSQYVEGYGYLTEYYNKKLQDSTKKFMLDRSVENAEKVRDNYNTLFKLRMEGEKAYAELNDVNGLVYGVYKACMGSAVYQANIDVANNNIKMLNEYCQFGHSKNTLNISEKKYIKKIIVSCPVDVTVYSSDGNIVCQLIDGQESDITNTHGRFICKYINNSQDYAKVIYLDDIDVSVKISGAGQGLMDCKVYASGDNGMVNTIMNYPVSSNTSIDLSVNAATPLFVDKANGESAVIPFEKVDTFQRVDVESIDGIPDTLTLKIGEKKQLSPIVLPVDAGNKNVVWWSSDQDIVTVNDGIISAISDGSATVKVTSEDTCASKEIIINVEKATDSGNTGDGGNTGDSGGTGNSGNTGSSGNTGGGSHSGGSSGAGGGSLPGKGSRNLVIPDILTTNPNILTGSWQHDGTGWRLIIGAETYARNQWAYLDGKWYVFNNAGYMVTGMCMVNHVRYYLNTDGAMAVGWVSYANSWYYFSQESGAMCKGWIQVNEKWYYLDGNGVLLTGRRTPDGFIVNENGEWVE